MKFVSEPTRAAYRCSANQERYIKASLAGENSYYLPLTFLLEETAEIDRLVEAINRVVLAEPALNVAIRSAGGHFVCEQPSSSPIECHYAQEDTALENVPGLIEDFIFAKRSVIGAPPCKVHVVRLSGPDRGQAVTIALHHAMADAISLGLFIDRVSHIYSGVSAATPAQSNYFSLCEHHRLMPGRWQEEEVDYWRHALCSAADETRQLPLFSSAASGAGGQRASVHEVLLPDEMQAVKTGASRAGVTTFEFVFAAYLATLARQTGAMAACATFQSSGRRGKPDLDGVIGEFSNALPVFATLDPGQGFDAFAKTVRGGVRAGIAHDNVPYDEIIRATGFHPRFGINWYPGTETLVLDGHAYPAQHLVEWQSDYDLNLHCIHRNGSISLEMSHPGGSAFAQRAKLVLGQMVALLKQVSHDGAVSPSRISLPGPALPEAVVKDAPAQTLWQRFAGMADRQPESAAIASGDRPISYGELRAMVDLSARKLASKGVVAGCKLALLVDRGPELVALLLAADRLGAIFAIYDPTYPQARIEVMDQTFRPDFHLGAEVSAPDSAIIGDIGLRSRADAGRAAPLASGTSYVLFTSGTTGKPKCVATAAQGLLSFLDWHIAAHDFGPASRFSWLGGLGHDPMLRDIFTALLCGGTVCIPPAEFRDDPRRLFDWLLQERVTAAHLTPQMGKLISMGRRDGPLTDLRHVFLGGDKLHWQDAEALSAAAPNAECTVFYGLTETPQAAAAYRVARPVSSSQESLIGGGVNGRRVTVRRDGQDAGYGEVGEIIVEGSDLFLGYYDAEAGMTQVTVQPLRAHPTGDTGFFAPSGDIAIVGRVDDQVKIRGYRVEPAEIVAFLRSQPGVDQAAILVEPMADGENRLLAYATPAGDASMSSSGLMDACRRQLPKHMLPHELFILDALPLTINGKLDRAALPRLREEPEETAIVDPETEAELAVAEEVRRTLGLKAVSMTSSVRDLGADSLSYLNLMLGLEKVVGSLPAGWDELSLRDLAAVEGKRGRLALVESTILMRAISIIAVVAGHFDLISFKGATSALYFIAGHSFGRFQVASIIREDGPRSVLRTIGQIALPTLGAMIVLQIAYGKITPITWAFLGNFVHPMVADGLTYWFVDVLIQMLLILAALFALPPVRRMARRYPYETAFGFTILAYAIGALGKTIWDTDPLFDRVPTSKIWLIGLGWCLAQSKGPRQRVATSLLALALLAIHWGLGHMAQPLTLTAFAMILLIDRIKMPRMMGTAVALTAAASLFIYLTHFYVRSIVIRIPGVPDSDWLAVGAAVVMGIVFHRLWETCTRMRPRLI